MEEKIVWIVSNRCYDTFCQIMDECVCGVYSTKEKAFNAMEKELEQMNAKLIDKSHMGVVQYWWYDIDHNESCECSLSLTPMELDI